MKITICGSIAFFGEMLSAKQKLEAMGHEVKLPPTEVPGKDGKMISVQEYYKIRKAVPETEAWVWDRKEESIMAHFRKIEWSDCILVLNHEKKGIPGYIGANTLMEMGLALWLGKKIFLLNQVPAIDSKEEILGMKPIVINGDYGKLSLG